MGGDHAEHHHEPFKVPDYKVYDKWRSYPDLVQHERRLAQFGLKDPWIRNYVWIYDVRNLSMGNLVVKTLGAGFKPGVAYAVIAIAITEALTAYYKKDKHHGGHAAHGAGAAASHH